MIDVAILMHFQVLGAKGTTVAVAQDLKESVCVYIHYICVCVYVSVCLNS